MDFDLNDEQQAVRDLAEQILGEQVTHERLKALEENDERFDRPLWASLADAGLLGIALPEDAGGAGLGFLEVCLILEQVGRTAALLPVLPTIVLGALPVAEFGRDEQRAALLPGVAAGDLLLTAALTEPGTEARHPITTARQTPEGWRLDGTKVGVPGGLLADRVIVPARSDDNTVLVFVVDPTAPGVTRTRQDTTSGVPEAMIELDGVTVGDADLLGDRAGGQALLDWMIARATVAMCAITAGVCEAALRLTAEYTKTREQFGRQIATFQAVGQRAANAYVDTEAVRLTMLHAAWRLSEGLPAASEVAVAKFWTAEGGQRVVHAASHLHGGVGVDRDYPLHRYFLAAKQLELSLGSATPQLRDLGALLAAQPV